LVESDVQSAAELQRRTVEVAGLAAVPHVSGGLSAQLVWQLEVIDTMLQ
jgi:hypothetical protein